MQQSDEEYAWKFTGYPFLDGLIFAAGVPRNRFTIMITVSYLPLKTVQKIEDKFNEIGYEAGCVEIPNANTKQSDLRIQAVGSNPIFNVLPVYRERRLNMDETPKEFIEGFFAGSIKIKLEKYSSKNRKQPDGIMIRTSLPKKDVEQLLELLGITEYELWFKKMFIKRNVFKNIEPFEEIFNQFVEEEKIMMLNMPTKDEAFDNKMKELSDDLWGKPEEFDGDWEGDKE